MGKTMPVDFASKLKFISSAACEVVKMPDQVWADLLLSGSDHHPAHLFSSLI